MALMGLLWKIAGVALLAKTSCALEQTHLQYQPTMCCSSARTPQCSPSLRMSPTTHRRNTINPNNVIQSFHSSMSHLTVHTTNMYTESSQPPGCSVAMLHPRSPSIGLEKTLDLIYFFDAGPRKNPTQAPPARVIYACCSLCRVCSVWKQCYRR